jgi:hypothetical protein
MVFSQPLGEHGVSDSMTQPFVGWLVISWQVPAAVQDHEGCTNVYGRGPPIIHCGLVYNYWTFRERKSKLKEKFRLLLEEAKLHSK